MLDEHELEEIHFAYEEFCSAPVIEPRGCDYEDPNYEDPESYDEAPAEE